MAIRPKSSRQTESVNRSRRVSVLTTETNIFLFPSPKASPPHLRSAQGNDTTTQHCVSGTQRWQQHRTGLGRFAEPSFLQGLKSFFYLSESFLYIHVASLRLGEKSERFAESIGKLELREKRL